MTRFHSTRGGHSVAALTLIVTLTAPIILATPAHANNYGAKGQEPLQLGIRTTLEEATLRLIGGVLKSDPESCLALRPPEQRPRLASDRIAAVANDWREPRGSLP